MERQQARMCFFGTLAAVVILALAYYFFAAKATERGYRGMLVDVSEGCEIEWQMPDCNWSI